MRHAQRAMTIIAALCALAAGAYADLVLVEEGKDPCPILIPKDSNKRTQEAAQELARYLGQMSGAKFAVETAPDPLPDRAILVGRFEQPSHDEVGSDGFVIRTEGQHLRITGWSSPGTLYGVYGFLEDVLGCRWWTHTEEHVPQKATIKVGDLNITCKPPFTLHNVYNREAQSKQNNFVNKARTTGHEWFTGSHSLYPLLREYAKDHPEIYPMAKDGKRKANNLHFCYIAPGIPEALAEALGKQVEKRKGNVADMIYFAGMGDWYGGMCQCPECKKIYEEEVWTDPDGRKKPGYTASLLRMMNRTGEILNEKYPGIRLGTFAYMSLEAPPAKMAPAQNVTIRVPRLRHCTVHSAGACKKNASYLRNLERWC